MWGRFGTNTRRSYENGHINHDFDSNHNSWSLPQVQAIPTPLPSPCSLSSNFDSNFKTETLLKTQPICPIVPSELNKDRFEGK